MLNGVVFKPAGLKPGDVNVMGVRPQVAAQSLVGECVDAAFLFEQQASIAQLSAPVKPIYEIGEVWPFPGTVVNTSGDTLKKRKSAVWKSLVAPREAIYLMRMKPAEASRLIAGYFISGPTLKTLKQGELPRETVIIGAIESQSFSAALTRKDLVNMQEVADILQQQGSLKTGDGRPFGVINILDLSWQKERKP